MEHEPISILPHLTYLVGQWQRVINILHKLSVQESQKILSQKSTLNCILGNVLQELLNDYKHVITNLFPDRDNLWSICIRYQWFVCYFTVMRVKEALGKNNSDFHIYALLPSKEELQQEELGIVCVNDIMTKLFSISSCLRDEMIWGIKSPDQNISPRNDYFFIFKDNINVDKLLIYSARLESFPVLPDCLYIYSNSTNEVVTDNKPKQLNLWETGDDFYNNKDVEIRVCLRCKINCLHIGITDKQEQRTHFHCHCCTLPPTSEISMKASRISRVILLSQPLLKFPKSHLYNSTFLHSEIIRNKFSVISNFIKSVLKNG